MTFDFLAILIGLGATVLRLGAWFIKFAHSNEAGQKDILGRLEGIAALLKAIDERAREWQLEQRRIADGLTQVAEIARLLSQDHHENRIQQRAEHERLVRLGEEVVTELKAMRRVNLAEHTKLVTLMEKKEQ